MHSILVFRFKWVLLVTFVFVRKASDAIAAKVNAS